MTLFYHFFCVYKTECVNKWSWLDAAPSSKGEFYCTWSGDIRSRLCRCLWSFHFLLIRRGRAAIRATCWWTDTMTMVRAVTQALCQWLIYACVTPPTPFSNCSAYVCLGAFVSMCVFFFFTFMHIWICSMGNQMCQCAEAHAHTSLRTSSAASSPASRRYTLVSIIFSPAWNPSLMH